MKFHSFSYSKISTHNECPYKFKLRYVDKLEPIDDLRPNNALYMGTAMHEGIEKRSIDEAIKSYKSHYQEFTGDHEIELYRIESILPKALEQIPEGEYEHQLKGDDGFIGYIDCLVPVDEDTYDILDYKFSNNVGGYRKSGQIHLYKYYFEKLTGKKIRNLYYVFIPKSTKMLKESIDEEIKDKNIIFEKVEFDRQQVNFFFARKALCEKDDEYPKRYTNKCSWCEFKKYCQSNGADISELKVKEKKEEVKEVSLF